MSSEPTSIPEDERAPDDQGADNEGRQTTGTDAEAADDQVGEAAAPDDQGAENEGRLLDGRYRLETVVGEGGMARVWRAQDAALGRSVAIKILRPQFAADPEFVDRFKIEGRSAAGLNHPGVVAVYDVGESESGHYLVMEYVPGKDLKQVVREEAPLAPAKAVRIASAVAHAVGHAHDNGLVHRDVKPQNVIAAPDGRLKVADFGIARAAAAVGTTAPGIVLGTVHYLSPEQAAGGPASPASDVYSLGVVLYEMLTGKVPFEADSSVGVAMKIVNEDPEPVDRLNPRVPTVLANIVSKAMARQPEARYQDASAMAEALDGFARWSDQMTGAMPPVQKTLADEGAVDPVARSGTSAAPSGTSTAGPPTAGTQSAAGSTPVPGGASGSAPGAAASTVKGPLLDRTGLLLAVLAFAAVAGLIPLWAAVFTQVEPARLRETLGVSVPPTPTAAPTATEAPPAQSDVEVEVPSVVNMSEEEAARVLRDRGLGFSVETTESVTVTQGTVIDQRPRPGGAPEFAGTVVKLTVAGTPLTTVPEPSGGYQDVAAALIGAGLEPVRRDRWTGSDGPAGEVLAVDPPAGSRLPRGSPVFVTVNSGPWMPVGVDFEAQIHLSGVEVARSTLAPGETLSVVARWQATGPIEVDYSGVAELVGADTVARDGHPPLGGSRPTSSWTVGEVIFGDAYELQVGPDVPPGDYQLLMGLEAPDGTPIPISNAAGQATRGAKVVIMDVQVGS